MLRSLRILGSPARLHQIRRASQKSQNGSGPSLVSTKGTGASKEGQNIITMDTAKKWKEMSTGERVVFATKQTSYTGVILAGLGISATLIFFVMSELFSGNQATGVYEKAFDMVKNNEQAKLLLGEPIRGYRQHQRGSHKVLQTFNSPEDGGKMAFMRFGIAGAVNEGTVNVLLKANKAGNLEYQYVNVEVPGMGYPSKRVNILDHRQTIESSGGIEAAS